MRHCVSTSHRFIPHCRHRQIQCIQRILLWSYPIYIIGPIASHCLFLCNGAHFRLLYCCGGGWHLALPSLERFIGISDGFLIQTFRLQIRLQSRMLFADGLDGVCCISSVSKATLSGPSPSFPVTLSTTNTFRSLLTHIDFSRSVLGPVDTC